MPDGAAPAKAAATPEAVLELTTSVMEEQRALLDLLPGWVKVLTGLLLATALAAAIAACAAAVLVSGPAFPLAAAACAMAVVALIGYLLMALIEYGIDRHEAAEIKEKMDRLEEMKAALQD